MSQHKKPKKKKKFYVKTVDANGDKQLQAKTWDIFGAIQEARIWLNLGTPVLIEVKWKKP